MPDLLRSHHARRGFAVAALLAAFVVLATVAAPPAQALYAKLWNTLDGPAIGGVVPTGEAHINQCQNPGSSFDLTLDVENVNLPDGTRLTVTYTSVGTIGRFRLNDGAGHFETTVAWQAGANDDIFVKQGSTTILSATDRWDTGIGCP